MLKYQTSILAGLILFSQPILSQTIDSNSKTNNESSPAKTFIGYVQTFMIIGGGVGLTGYAKRGALKELIKRHFPGVDLMTPKVKASAETLASQTDAQSHEEDDGADDLNPSPSLVQRQPMPFDAVSRGATQLSFSMIAGLDPSNELRRRAAAGGLNLAGIDVDQIAGEIESAIQRSDNSNVLLLARTITQQNIFLFDRVLLRRLREFLSCNRSKAANLIIEKITNYLEMPDYLESVV